MVTEAEIVIDNDVILDGEGKLTIDGDGDGNVLSVPGGVTAELRGFTVTGGGWGRSRGRGIESRGTLTIRGCVISGNEASVTGGDVDGGGGIRNAGQMTIIDTTIAENQVSHGQGGGIYNRPSATLTLVNSTVSHNLAGVDNGGSLGGGIWNEGELTIVNSTVSENSIGSCCGGIVYGDEIYSPGADVADKQYRLWGPPTGKRRRGRDRCFDAEIANTLIDGDCEIDSTVSGGYNIQSPGDTCGFNHETDQVNVSADDLKLGPLADNGGPTQTHALGGGSVAIDRIPEADCEVETDQRGLPRDSMCDVGSVEVQP